jgi:hypothetical protein
MDRIDPVRRPAPGPPDPVPALQRSRRTNDQPGHRRPPQERPERQPPEEEPPDDGRPHVDVRV